MKTGKELWKEWRASEAAPSKKIGKNEPKVAALSACVPPPCRSDPPSATPKLPGFIFRRHFFFLFAFKFFLENSEKKMESSGSLRSFSQRVFFSKYKIKLHLNVCVATGRICWDRTSFYFFQTRFPYRKHFVKRLLRSPCKTASNPKK